MKTSAGKHKQGRFAKRGLLHRALILAAIVSTLALGTARAVIVQTNTSDPSTVMPVSATDLINQGQSTLLSAASTSPATSFGGNYTLLNNGASGGAFTDSASDGANSFTVTYTLDTSINTLGYDITGVDTFAASFTYAGIGWQSYELLYSTVGSASFISLGTFTLSGNNDYYTKVALTSSGGPIASGVDQVQFALGPMYNANGTGWTELDVIGVATVPEPPISAMFAFAGIGILLLIRKRNLSTSR